MLRYISFLGIFLFVLTASANAATYFVVDGVGESCSDSNAGTKTSPWCHCPGMYGWTGSATLSVGDTVYFESTGTWSYSSVNSNYWLLVGGGVHYIGNSWPVADTDAFPWCQDGGCAKVDLVNSDFNVIIHFLEDHPTTETIVTGFELDGNMNSCGNAIGFNSRDGRTGNVQDITGATKRIEKSYIHETRTENYGACNAQSYYAYGIAISTGNNGETNHDVENVEILDNYLYRIQRNAIVAYPNNQYESNYVGNITIRGNYIMETGATTADYNAPTPIDLKNWVKNATIEFNYIYAVETNALVLASRHEADNRRCENCTARYNIIDSNDTSTNNGILLADSAINSNTTEYNIYGNIIIGSWGQYAIKVGRSTNNLTGPDIDLRIYNNTIYSASSEESIIIYATTATVNTGEVKNNIVDGSITDADGSFTLSNNSTDETCLKNTSNLPAGFTGTYGSDMEPDKDGLSINTSTGCDNDGADLGSDPYYGAINFNGKAGGLNRDDDGGSSWDIGAYEVNSNFKAQAPLPPTGLVIQESKQ